MSKTHKVSIILAMAVLTALGVSLIRGWPPLATAAGGEPDSRMASIGHRRRAGATP